MAVGDKRKEVDVMKKNRTISKTGISASLKPAAILMSTAGYTVSNDLPLNIITSKITKVFFIPITVLCFLVIPKEVMAFDLGNMLNNAVKSIEQHMPGKANKKEDATEKKVDEMMNHVFGKPSAAPQHGAAENEVYQQKKRTNKEVQQYLNSLGYNVGPADGALGPMSVKAIKAFQRDHGMAQTGRISSGLLAALKSAGGKSATALSSSSKSLMVTSTAQSQGIKDGGILKAQVHEKLLGPNVNKFSGGGVFVSEDGGHVAIAMMKGSRQVISVDGVKGPVFDAVSDPPQFNSTGQHCAYGGRRGDEIIAVFDGKEIAAMGKIDKQKRFHFSDDGARLAYISVTTGGTFLDLVVDGKTIPGNKLVDPSQIAFGGKHLAYAAQTMNGKWHVVVDDKMGPAYDGIRSLHWSDYGAHYTYVGKQNWQHDVVVVDGIEEKPYLNNSSGQGIDALALTANGHMAYRAQQLNTQNTCGGILVLDRKEVTKEACSFRFEHSDVLSMPSYGKGILGSWWFALSPDGRRIAFVRRTGGGKVAVVDGKPGSEYDDIFDLQFSPDGKRAAYVGKKGLFNFVVVDGKESARYNQVKEFRFSADSKHYAYEAYHNGTGYTVVVDGKEGPNIQELMEGSLTFSPDGKRYAYAGYPNFKEGMLVVDGKVVSNGRIEKFQTQGQMRGSPKFPVLVFSPNGNSLAFIEHKGGTGKQYLVVGKQSYPSFYTYSYPSFSSDGKHFAAAAWTGKKVVILMDGHKGPIYDQIVQANETVFRFIDDHTLRFLAVKNGSIYRVTISFQSHLATYSPHSIIAQQQASAKPQSAVAHSQQVAALPMPTTTHTTAGQQNRPAANSGPTLFTEFYNGLLGFKFLPELYLSDAVLSYLTQQQIRRESEEWATIDRMKTKFDPYTGKTIGKISIPTFTFTWADAKNNAKLKAIYIRHFLGKDLDWSFLYDYGYNPRKGQPIVQFFIFQREKYLNRMPEFATVELSPVYREFLETVLPLIPTSYILHEPVQLKYNQQRQDMSFIFYNNKNTDQMMADVKGYFGELTPKNRGSGKVFPPSLKEKKIYDFGYNGSLPETSTRMPGTYKGIDTGYVAEKWREIITSYSYSSDAPKVGAPKFLVLDRDLKLAPVHIRPSEAEKILNAQQKGPLSAELYFEITGAKPADWFVNGKDSKFAVLLGKVHDLRIVDAAGNEVLNVPLKTLQAIENEREKQQAEAEAQARQKEAKTQANQQAVADMQTACWNGHTFDQVSGCLNDMYKRKSPEASNNRKAWIALSIGKRYAKSLKFMARSIDHYVKQECDFGVYKAYKGVRDYSTIQQKTSACIDAVIPAMKKEEDSCLAENRPPLALKDGIEAIQKCMYEHARVLVNKYYGLDSKH